MTETKTFLCLANSKREGRLCLAGKEVLADNQAGDWIRPVSNINGDGVSKRECRDINVLDIITVELGDACPINHQRENWLFSSWREHALGSIQFSQLSQYADSPDSLSSWDVGSRADRVSFDDIGNKSISNSLCLISVDKVEFYKRGRQLRAKFDKYNLSVTDTKYKRHLREVGVDFPYTIYNPYLTVSLADVLEGDGNCYKLVAAVFEDGEARQQ